MISIYVYNYDLSTPLTTFSSPSYSNLSVKKVHMGIGSAQFDIDLYDAKATPTNLRKYNRIKIYDNATLVFNGYITSWRLSEQSNQVTVVCKHAFGLFDKRKTGASENQTGNAGVAIFAQLASTNGVKNTNITAGTDTSAVSINQTFKHQTLWKAWQDICKAGSAEIELADNDKINVAPQIGTDKSASVIIKFTETQENTNNITELDYTSEGDDMGNAITGLANALTSTQVDAVSQALYGLLEKVESFSDQPNQATLDKITTDTLIQKAYSADLPRVTIDNTKIAPYSLKLGDTVRVRVQRGALINMDSNCRITAIDITYGDTGQPVVKLTFSDVLTRNIIPDGVQDILKMRDRILALERK